jgi:hypothetical protein
MTQHTPTGRWARALWAAGEPFVLGFLVTPEGRDALTALGVPKQAVYFAVRSAPLGRADVAVIASAFHGFPIALVRAALSGVWERVTPAEVVAAHHASLPVTAARVFGDTVDMAELHRLGDRLTEVCRGLETAGRPLAAGNQALVAPTEPWARFWHACTTLREHRGDAHIAALVTADLGVAESLVLTDAWASDRIDTAMLRTSRGLSDAVWAAARGALVDRGLMTAAGALTLAGTALRDRVEEQTDLASLRPWAALGPADRTAVHDFLTALSTHMVATGAMRSVTPVGAPWPPPRLD